jgi:uncharacterized membrane protein YsdA (DUF1294 family)
MRPIAFSGEAGHNDWVIFCCYRAAMTNFVGFALFLLVLVNVWTLICFWQDKQAAVAGERRISESDLLGLALIGGSPAALVARRLFRHKTRKEPFSTNLLVIVTLQIGAIVGFAIA